MKFLRTLRQSLFRDIPCMAVTSSNDPMLSVAMDAPVFYKPGLDGLDAALARLFARAASAVSRASRTARTGAWRFRTRSR